MSYNYSLSSIPSQLVWGTTAGVCKSTPAETAAALKLALATQQTCTITSELVNRGIAARDDLIAAFVMQTLQETLTPVESDILRIISKTNHTTHDLRDFSIIATAWHVMADNRPLPIDPSVWSTYVDAPAKSKYTGVLVPVATAFIEYKHQYLVTAYVENENKYIDFYLNQPPVIEQRYAFSCRVSKNRNWNITHVVTPHIEILT